MILRRIELRSFRQFVETDIDFDLGVTAIVGSNGSGKTTILEALKFALYGENRGKKPDLANMHHGGKPSVAIEFDLNGVRYRCERDLNNASTCRKVGEEWSREAFSLSGVTAFSQKLLGLTDEQFCSSYMTEQKEIEFLKFSRARQQEQIAQMLGIEVLAAAARQAKELGKTSEAALKEIEAMLESKASLERDLESKKVLAKEKEAAVVAAKVEVESAELKLAELTPLNEQANEYLTLLARTRIRADVGKTLKAEVGALIAELEERKKEVLERNALEPVAAEHKEVSAKFSELSKLQGQLSERERMLVSRESLQISVEEIKTTINPKAKQRATEIAKELADAGKRREEDGVALDTATAKWREDLLAAKTASQRAGENYRRLCAELVEVEEAEAKGVCPTCGQKMPDGHAPRSIALRADIDKICSELEESEAKATGLAIEPEPVVNAKLVLATASANFEQTQRMHVSAEHEAVQQEAAELRFKKIQEEIGALTTKIDAAPTSFDKVLFESVTERLRSLEPGHRRWVELSSAPQRAEATKVRYEEKAKQFENERMSQEADKQRMEEIGIDEERAKQTQAEFSTIANSIPHLKLKLGACSEAHQLALAAVIDAEKRIETWKENADRIDKHRHDRDLYTAVCEAMTDLRSSLNSQIRPTIATFAGEALGIITDNRYTRVHIDESFNATLYDGEHRKNVVSGGEEDVLALALRIALSRYVQEKSGHPLSLLVLDEVFGSLDSDRRTNVLEWLDGLKAMFPQIIWISHVDGMTEQADRVLRVTFDRKEKRSVVEDFYAEPISI